MLIHVHHIANTRFLHKSAFAVMDSNAVATAPPSASDEDESKSLVARPGDVTTDDDPQESTADEEEEDEDEDENDSDEDKLELSDGASMLRLMQNLPEDEARRHEQFRRSHFERGAIKRVMDGC